MAEATQEQKGCSKIGAVIGLYCSPNGWLNNILFIFIFVVVFTFVYLRK